MPHLIVCPSCSCHAKAEETHCPECGAYLVQAEGSVRRTAAALLLGLTAVTLPVIGASCSTEVVESDDDSATSTTTTQMQVTTTEVVSAYGIGGYPGVGGYGGNMGGNGGYAGEGGAGVGGAGEGGE